MEPLTVASPIIQLSGSSTVKENCSVKSADSESEHSEVVEVFK